VFPEINVDKIDVQRGMDITIVTTAVTNESGKALLDAFGFPFKKGADADTAPRKRSRNRHAQRGPVKGAKPAAKKK
jgi:large subunit ribosomal protein L5